MLRSVASILIAVSLLTAPALAQQTVVLPIIKDQAGLVKGAVPTILVDQTGAYVAAGGGGGGGGAVTAASGAYALGSIVDIGTGASPGANTVNGRLSTINTTLGTPLQAGGSIANITGTISLPTGAATAANQIPSATAANGLTTVTVAGASTNVLKSTPGNVYSLNVVDSTTAGFVVLYDATTAPTSGTVLTTTLIRYCFPIVASAGFDKVFPVPVVMTNGAVELESTSCTTYTAPAVAPILMTGQVK